MVDLYGRVFSLHFVPLGRPFGQWVRSQGIPGGFHNFQNGFYFRQGHGGIRRIGIEHLGHPAFLVRTSFWARYPDHVFWIDIVRIGAEVRLFAIR